MPCQKVEIGLNAFGPGGRKDLSLTLGFDRVKANDSIWMSFYIPTSHSSYENSPYLVVYCSGIHRANGKLIDWIPVALPLVKAKDSAKSPDLEIPAATPTQK